MDSVLSSCFEVYSHGKGPVYLSRLHLHVNAEILDSYGLFPLLLSHLCTVQFLVPYGGLICLGYGRYLFDGVRFSIDARGCVKAILGVQDICKCLVYPYILR